jgi:hypothetical protein
MVTWGQGAHTRGSEAWLTRESELKGGTIGKPDDESGFIYSALDAVLHAVIDSVLLELIIL